MNAIKKIFLLLLIVVNISYLYGQTNTVSIWNGVAPGSENIQNEEKFENGRYTNVYQPELSIFLANQKKGNNTSVIIFPGGGYTHLAFEKEGIKIARWLNENGINAFVLKYRLDENLALMDAKRAIKYVRANAKEFNIDPNKIGIMGFSAGGHLSANLIVNGKTSKEKIIDNIDTVNYIPNFVVLIYPWLQNLYQQIGKEFPATFIVHASDDKRVPVQQSINFYNELLKRNVSVELHIYEKGGHGFGIEPNRGRAAMWGNIFIDWLKSHSLIED